MESAPARVNVFAMSFTMQILIVLAVSRLLPPLHSFLSVYMCLTPKTDRITAFLFCSVGVCPYGTAWADKAYALNSAHNLAECSDLGICNRENVNE